MAKEKGPNTEQRGRPEGFHSARKNKGHPKKVARQERAIERLKGKEINGNIA